MDAETRAARLENVLRAILDQLDMYGHMYESDQVAEEARALLDGEGAPAD